MECLYRVSLRAPSGGTGIVLSAFQVYPQESGLFKMGTRQVTHCYTWFVLLGGLVICMGLEWGVVSARAAGSSGGTMAAGLLQGGKDPAGQQNTPNSKRVVDDYRIGPSDVLAINVWKDSELTRTVVVRPDGKISLPLVGELEVSGLTASSVQRLIGQRLAEYISSPQVTVMVQEVKSQTYVVVGKVVKPGSFELGKPTTVLEAIAICGGFLDFAKSNKVKIIRRASGGQSETLYFDYNKVIKGKNAEQNVELHNGDTIVVP
jgi:polysaccharide export outer membrane protein